MRETLVTTRTSYEVWVVLSAVLTPPLSHIMFVLVVWVVAGVTKPSSSPFAVCAMTDGMMTTFSGPSIDPS